MSMRVIAALVMLSAAAGCAGGPRAAGPTPQAGSWLVGLWLPIADDGGRSLAACESDAPVEYLPDGSYAMFEERGDWRLDGNKLTQVMREVTDAGDDADRTLIGVPVTARIEPIGTDEARIVRADGSAMRLLRCPPPAR